MLRMGTAKMAMLKQGRLLKFKSEECKSLGMGRVLIEEERTVNMWDGDGNKLECEKWETGIMGKWKT